MHIKDTLPELYRIRRRPLTAEGVRASLAEKRGREFWQSLEELAETEEFDELLHREFPQHAAEWDEGTDRRTFLKLMGASLALAGLTGAGCSYQPPETIVPYVTPPDGLIPGKALYFATAMPWSGGAAGLLVRSNMGRPTKVEGNPDHPASGTPERAAGEREGSTDVFAQAAILELYDPDRSETISNRGEVRTYTNFLGEVSTQLERQREKRGAGLRFLTEPVISPTLAAQLDDIITRYPGAKWYQYEPAGSNSAAVGARLAFGEFVSTRYNFAEADRVLSLDSDFLSCGPANLRHARDFADRRRAREGMTREMNRLYAIETTPTNTGLYADHRLAVRPSELEPLARAVAAALGAQGVAAGAGLNAEQTNFVNAVAADLKEHAGRSVVVAGDEQTPLVHALAHAMNAALTNVGKTVFYTEPVEEFPSDHLEDLRALLAEVDAGQVDMLVVVGGNPVFNAPADFNFGDRIKAKNGDRDRVPFRAHLSLYDDETSELCHWHIPQAHFLESWSDTRAFDGSVSIIQPLITPLYNGRSAHEFLGAFTETPERSGYDILREYWSRPDAGTRRPRVAQAAAAQATAQPTPAAAGASQPQPSGSPAPPQGAATPRPAGTPAPSGTPQAATSATATATPSADFERNWRKWVHDGVIPGKERPTKNVTVRGDFASASTSPSPAGGGGQLEIVFRPDPTVYDGRFANNGWLQELPKPLTKLTWDNAAIISPGTAVQLDTGVAPDGALVEGGPVRVNRLSKKGGEIIADVLRLSLGDRRVEAPIFIMPGQPDGVVTVHLGYGRRRAGRVGGNAYEKHFVGFDAYQLRTSNALWHATGARVEKTGATYSLASTQIHFQMEGREIVRHGSFEDYKKDPTLAHGGEHAAPAPPVGENKPPHDTETLYHEYPYDDPNYNSRLYKWGMVIDLSTCVGCNACVIACQAENNIPVVGKEQVLRSREMHWIRVDAYFRKAADNPAGVYFMPVPCMHCENAPCEPVCPVHATVHSAEGINDMVYNRCIGTRYCSNNCPYKVRRFNFLLFQDWDTPSLKMMRNPEVSVRSRGVMEKCTYCIQRIEYAKIESEKEQRRVRDGEIVTACQGACPTEAIVFGDLADGNSRVAKMHAQKHRYALLADLNTRPRTVYLAAVRNPNPALGGEA